MKKITFILYLFLLIITFNACQKVIEFNDKDIKPLLVVNSFINTDSVVIDVSRSYSSLEEVNHFSPLHDASIKISDGENVYTNFEYIFSYDTIYEYDKYGGISPVYNENGYYKSTEFNPQEGHTYKIEVAVNGYETVYAETTMPYAVKIESVDTVRTLIESNNGYMWYRKVAQMKFTDPLLSENFYKIELQNASLNLSIDTITGAISLYPSIYKSNANIDDFISNSDDGTDFLSGGIDNGGCFTDDMINGEPQTLEIFLETSWISTNNDEEYSYKPPYKTYTFNMYRIRLLSITADMMTYIRTSLTQKWYDEDPFAEPVIVYNNIQNGIGIFASYSVDQKSMITKEMPPEIKELLPEYNTTDELYNIIEKLYNAERAKWNNGYDYY